MSANPRPLYVTQPSLPPLEEFIPHLRAIWDRRMLTNAGPCHQELEAKLAAYFGVEHVSLFANATVALVMAMQAMKLRGEVITTPFSFVATSHTLVAAGLEPVFVDVEPGTLNLDPRRIEAAITPRTSAILPVHCYGRSCDVEAIEAIARRHDLKVLYDAAHAFGVHCHCGSVLQHGDMSVLSFHATKVFNSAEGGAVISRTAELKERLDRLRNFGIVDETTITDVGGNGKMSELHAALGLVQLGHVDGYIARRGAVDAIYRERLADVSGLRCIPVHGDARPNFAYFPVLVEPAFALTRDQLYDRLKAQGIFSRRYFFPLISQLPMYRDRASASAENLPVATEAAQRILCLPIHADMTDADAHRVVDAIRALR